ncbi:M28 family metallopeptidase [Nocardioides caricicola]|uniref:M28 family metallopeptidase n=1 Tax=Nocardioides caricicola TaxID=634770 RepID=A0ABW0MW60_9ACTN
MLASTMPRTSPIAQPVRQRRVAATAARRLSSVAVLLLVTACSDTPLTDTRPPSVTTPPATSPATSSTAEPTPTPTSTPTPEPTAAFDATRAMRTVRHLAGDIGPRLATGPAFLAAVDWATPLLATAGYDVRLQRFAVPAGDSWGVPVEAGRSLNVIAEPPGFDPGRRHVVVGAHLDTVAVAPGAEDNASGVAVVMELARILAGQPRVVLVLFGGEEPVGTGELHHFGSKRYAADPGNVTAMVSLDRVGVGDRVPLASVEGTPTGVRDELARLARRLRIPVTVGVDSASDHESFADVGIPAARAGSTPYAGYHSAGDVPSVVDPEQLDRVGRLLTAWLRGR